MAPPAIPVEAVVLADIAIVVAVCALLARLLRRLHQPPVVAEIAAGLLLGPSVLGLLPGDLPDHLFPADARLPLSAIANLGLVLLMFLCGWELDARQMRGARGSVGAVAVLAMALPFALGGGFATLIRDQAPHGARPLAFVLFLATAFSITAFPVLARLLRDQGLTRTRVGVMAMSSAALGDVVAWCVLVLVTAVAGGQKSGGFWVMLGWTAAFAAAMVLVVRPLLHRVLARLNAVGNPGAATAVVLCGILFAAFATSWIGVHPIFGAFAFGLLMPRRTSAGAGLGDELMQQVGVPLDRAATLLLPVFFMLTGLSVDIRHLGVSGLLLLVAALLVASAGKFLGAGLPVRLAGLRGREALAFGTLMNTRGLTEIVVLGIGRQLGLISGELFTVMVLVALLTTALAGPVLRFLRITGPTSVPTPEPAVAPVREVQTV
ncbi:cation/H(+) antiporter [Streptacidiphilus pinicola]|uniref:Cation/H(+) antiporter n=1 Tax=Streptacidiphilus pinicola TaxID=2219663 RepID=A0A2X0K7G7_9ACTN|nr:cation:proton antiporter [Streptacidiphilus pinicola]RAG83170.1 cation/H(+) antiporter [Streptacidiphilus pinicola]